MAVQARTLIENETPINDVRVTLAQLPRQPYVSPAKQGGALMRALKSIAFALALTTAPIAVQAVAAPSTIAAAVSSPTRSADNVKMDEGRKPAEVLSYLGLKPGMSVIDLFGSNKYWTEIIAPVVGPKGHVLVWEPTQFYDADAQKTFAEFAAKNPNVKIVSTPFEAISLPPNSADFVMLNNNYHDTYWSSEKYKIPKMDPAAFLKVVYAAMKPGAVIGVIDHAANAGGDTRATVDKLHRIDPAVVKADFERAGFVYAGSSDLLRNPADDHTLLVFDPKVRGKTDRFIYMFKKPR
jgi:predicted methyltransferase